MRYQWAKLVRVNAVSVVKKDLLSWIQQTNLRIARRYLRDKLQRKIVLLPALKASNNQELALDNNQINKLSLVRIQLLFSQRLSLKYIKNTPNILQFKRAQMKYTLLWLQAKKSSQVANTLAPTTLEHKAMPLHNKVNNYHKITSNKTFFQPQHHLVKKIKKMSRLNSLEVKWQLKQSQDGWHSIKIELCMKISKSNMLLHYYYSISNKVI